jgi:hypothetical protein
MGRINAARPLTTSRHSRRSAELYALHERYGAEILAGRMGDDRLRRAHPELSERKARTLCEAVREEGPVPARSGTRTGIVIGDPHAKAGQDLRRFSALGRLIVHIDPDWVICVGDWPDNLALSRFAPRTIDGRAARYIADQRSFGESVDRVHAEIDAFNESDPFNARNPWMGYCRGNHDDRDNSYIQSHEELEGTIDLDSSTLRRRGWNVCDFTSYLQKDGIYFTHYVQTAMGKAKSGVNLAGNILNLKHKSFIVGHTHAFDEKMKIDLGCDLNIRCMVAGCYFEDWEDYAGQNNEQWWRGVCVLRDVHDGRYDLEQWGMDRILRDFGED